MTTVNQALKVKIQKEVHYFYFIIEVVLRCDQIVMTCNGLF